MPASRFFLMLNTVDRLHGKELAQLCYVSRSAKMTDEAFANTVNEFSSSGEKKERPPDINLSEITKPSPLNKEQQKEALFGMLGADYRINRKVMRVH